MKSFKNIIFSTPKWFKLVFFIGIFGGSYMVIDNLYTEYLFHSKSNVIEAQITKTDFDDILEEGIYSRTTKRYRTITYKFSLNEKVYTGHQTLNPGELSIKSKNGLLIEYIRNNPSKNRIKIQTVKIPVNSTY